MIVEVIESFERQKPIINTETTHMLATLENTITNKSLFITLIRLINFLYFFLMFFYMTEISSDLQIHFKPTHQQNE